MSELNYGSARRVPEQLGDEMQEEHQAELLEKVERDHDAQEAAKTQRRWWRFWRRDAK